jgi:hypothetical protein
LSGDHQLKPVDEISMGAKREIKNSILEKLKIG